jgi:hypothetical protein
LIADEEGGFADAFAGDEVGGDVDQRRWGVRSSMVASRVT